jgi:integrase
MTALAAVTAPSPSGGCLLADYRAFVAGLEINPDTKRVRRRAAEQLAAAHPDLHAWMRRPTPARLVDLRRSGAWPFVTWLFVEGRLQPDLDLLLAKLPGDLFRSWQQRHPHDVARLREAAKRLEWSANWTRDVTAGLSLVGLWAQATLDELDDDVLAAFATAIEAAPAASATARAHNHARLLSLHQACYQLRICQRPPRKRIRGPATLARRCEAIPQPEIRRVALRYLETIAPTLRPGTVAMRTDNLIVFAEYLASAHPEVVRLTQLRRAPHIEGFLVWNHGRPWRGRVARDRPVVASVSHGTVVDLRMFFDHLAIWGWAERPPGRLLLPSDTGKLPRPLPRALPPDIDRALIGAVRTLDDLFVRCGLLMLRGTGLRIGELLDLELDCLWDTPSHGSWLRVPLGKLDTERMVPLDADTLAALDAWMARRGPHRALPHPRDGRPTDFLFVERGTRCSAYRLRKGLDHAVAIAGLTGTDRTPRRVTPHQLRHTFATDLVNGGMSLQALMALLGHVTPEMTLRYAQLASPTVRVAYDTAMAKGRLRQLPIVTGAPAPVVADRVAWLRSEMLKTRVAHGYCSRNLVADACAYANICEQCDNFVTAPEFLPALHEQLADVRALRDDAEMRGWNSEVARHARVITSLEGHIRRLQHDHITAAGS